MKVKSKGSGDKKVIYAALLGNGIIMLMKFLAAFFSGSAAMFAEALHSTADTANQVLLLFGMNRSKRPPDDRHPFGYGKEIYFWSFVVAVSIFFVGAVFSIYKGVDKILHPEQIHSYTLSVVVLLGAMVFEAYAFMVAYKEASKLKTKNGLFGFIDMAVRTKNPTIMVVLFEDSAALTGLTIALIGMGLSYYTGNLLIDGITSVAIGVLLLGVAVLLARETKELLIGESATEEDIEAMRRALNSIPEINKAGRLMTMHMGPDEILVNLDVEFIDGLSTDGVEEAIDKIERRLKQAVPAVKKIYIEAESLSSR